MLTATSSPGLTTLGVTVRVTSGGSAAIAGITAHTDITIIAANIVHSNLLLSLFLLFIFSPPLFYRSSSKISFTNGQYKKGYAEITPVKNTYISNQHFRTPHFRLHPESQRSKSY